jgi:hypothetical protein
LRYTLLQKETNGGQEFGRLKEKHVFKTVSPHNLTLELSERRIFYFFRCNPLKSPDPEKQKKANESIFAFIYFHLLAVNSPAG